MSLPEETEAFVSVDVETAGPNPSQYSLLSIGACMVVDPQRSFYVELKPLDDQATESALAVICHPHRRYRISPRA